MPTLTNFLLRTTNYLNKFQYIRAPIKNIPGSIFIFFTQTNCRDPHQPLTNKLNILHLTQSLKGIRLQFQVFAIRLHKLCNIYLSANLQHKNEKSSVYRKLARIAMHSGSCKDPCLQNVMKNSSNNLSLVQV